MLCAGTVHDSSLGLTVQIILDPDPTFQIYPDPTLQTVPSKNVLNVRHR